MNAAFGHITLKSPEPRYPEGTSTNENKSCPCGVGDGNRTCPMSVDHSDPNRSTDRVTELTAGQMLTIEFDETIDHTGRFRVAIDYDGADVADFNDNILLDVEDLAEPSISPQNPHHWQLTVQIPDMACTNCTLQLVQVMNNDSETPVMDPSNMSTYYQCADITITGAGPTPSTSGSQGMTAPSASAASSATPGSSSAPSSAVPVVSSTPLVNPVVSSAPMPLPSATLSADAPPPPQVSATATSTPPAQSSAAASASTGTDIAPPPSASAASSAAPVPMDDDGSGDEGTCAVSAGDRDAKGALVAAFGLGLLGYWRSRRRRG